jgi:crotonobetainyl-CoA:carnitine CoA-transferase CaiB-like acyl-CoA transferase
VLHAADNKNKRRTAVNHWSEAGLDLICRSADPVIEVSDPGSLAQCKLDYESIRRVSPKIVCGSVTGFRPNWALCEFGAGREHGMPTRSPKREVQEDRREGRALHG